MRNFPAIAPALVFLIVGASFERVCYGQDRACCLSDGTCVDMSKEDCLAQGGENGGRSSSCDLFVCGCPGEPEGCLAACCFPNGNCYDLSLSYCVSQGGTPQEEGTSCQSFVCACTTAPEDCVFRACCLPGGTCLDLPKDQCLARGGSNAAWGTACETFACPCPDEPSGCDDGVSCTVDSCDDAAGACRHVPDDSLCDDGLFCNGAERCDLIGGCQPGVPADCNANGVDDSCDIALGTSADFNQTLIPDECERSACMCGDLSVDRLINLADFSVLSLCFGLDEPTDGCSSTELLCSDLNADSRVDLLDISIFAVLYSGRPSGSPPACLNGDNPDPFPQRDKSADVLALEALFDVQLDLPTSGSPHYREVLIDQSQSGMSYTYYNIQGPLDGIISMFQASGRRDHFEFALELCENMVAAANQDRDGDGHPEWDGSFDGVPPSDGNPDVMLADFQGAVAIARLARLILTDPGLAAAYGNRGAALASFVSDHIVDKWLYTRNGLNWFRSLPNWSDKASMLVRMLADLYAINWDWARRNLAVELANQFITTTLVHDPGLDTYTWPDIAGYDTSHTNREASFINVCAETGIVFTDLDVQRVANTLTQLIWNGSLSDPRCNNFHTGDNSPYQDRGPWAWGLIYDGWIRSGRVSPDAQALGQAILDLTQTDPGINPTVSSSRHKAGVLAMSGHLARNLWLNGQ